MKTVPLPITALVLSVFVLVPNPRLGVVGLVSAIAITLLLRLALRAPAVQAAVTTMLGLDGEPPAPPAPAFRHHVWWALGLVVFGGALFASLEATQPRYFTQDDNFTQFLPVILAGARSLAKGHLLEWNPHQYLGAPVASLGVYALTYPPTYLSWGIARALGDEALTLEVFATLHILVGLVVTYFVAARMGMRPVVSAVVSITSVLCGYTLVAGRSWYYMLPVVVFAPLLVHAVASLETAVSPTRWVVTSGVMIGAFFHAGNAQMWVYGLMFVFVGTCTAILAKRITPRRAALLVPAMLLGLSIALPLAVVQARGTADVVRAATGEGIGRELLSMLVPGPFVSASHPNDIFRRLAEANYAELYYSGTFGPLVGLGMVFLLATVRPTRTILARNPWYVCALLAFVLALGPTGFLWQELARLPVFARFQQPFKFLAFLQLFLSFGAGMIVERVMRRRSHRIATFGLMASVAVLTALGAMSSRHAFYMYDLGTSPYPALPPVLANTGRVLPISPRHSVQPNYAWSLQDNFPSAYGVSSFDGYDPLVAGLPATVAAFAHVDEDPIAAARAYGLTHVVIYERKLQVWASDPQVRGWFVPWFSPAVTMTLIGAAPYARLGPIRVHQLPEADPLAFAEATPGVALPVSYTSDGASVDVATAGGAVIVNVLRRPELMAFADGRVVPSTPDRWGRVRVELPAGARRLEVRFVPPWRTGFATASVALLAAVVVMTFLRREPSRSESAANVRAPSEPPTG